MADLHRGIALPNNSAIIEPGEDELKGFLLVLRQALLMVVRYIEKKYGIETR
jgi:hypothetical protein